MAKTIAPSVQVSDSKIAGLFDQIRPVVRKSGLSDDQIQAVRDSGRMPKAFESMLRKLASEISGMFTLMVNYTKSAEDLIVEAAFDYKYVYAEIPVKGSGEVTANVTEVHLNRVITNRELVKELPNMVDPITALHFAIANPDEQRKYPLVTVWQNGAGEYFYLILNESAGDRGLYVNRFSPDDDWGEFYRFLVSCK